VHYLLLEGFPCRGQSRIPEQLTDAATLATDETLDGLRGDVLMKDGITAARPASYDKKVGLVLQGGAPLAAIKEVSTRHWRSRNIYRIGWQVSPLARSTPP
jgi:hypothetical protein